MVIVTPLIYMITGESHVKGPVARRLYIGVKKRRQLQDDNNSRTKKITENERF